MTAKKFKKPPLDNSSKQEKRVLKILKELTAPIETPLRVVEYILSDDGKTRTEIDFK